MYEILFYSDRNGSSPVLDYMRMLTKSKSKDSRIKLSKMTQCIGVLAQRGTWAGEPIVKHLDGEIWELRPTRDRVLFAALVGGRFLLLHCFLKQTQKTPAKEIERAKRELVDFIERGGLDGNT